jgi:WD40 repeat protein
MLREFSDRRPAAGVCQQGSTKIRMFDWKPLVSLLALAVPLAAFLPSKSELIEWPKQVSRGEVGTQILSFAMSGPSGEIATIDGAGHIKLRSPGSQWQIERPLFFPGHATALAFSSDGRFLAAGGSARGARLWDLSLPESEPIEIVPMRCVKRIAFAPDGRSLAIAALDTGTIVIWDLTTKRERRVWNCGSSVNKIAFSPDGRWLAVVSVTNNWSLDLWDVKSGSRRVLPFDQARTTSALAFTPDGALLASASWSEHHVRLWDIESRRERRSFLVQTGPVSAVAISPDGTLLATVAIDGTLGIWSVETGDQLINLKCVADKPRDLCFSPDGRTLVLTDFGDDDIRWWDLAELFWWSAGGGDT